MLIDHGAQTDVDLLELWSRIVFNMLVSNTDDHLRNHGFILVPGKGWLLSDAYDMNPVPDAHGLRLNVSEADNAQDIDLALSVALYFRITVKEANAIIERGQAVVRQWPKVAKSLRIPAREQQRMASAFRLAE
ncbi:HipA domain-containing protein [Propionivibrio sp.]|uniref:HipA domain-containing protein n=1 Tax=Propionivibrio sp. TaxID=2212460 RepID=UPI0025DE921C|nr:HipA domain-containing protein [Propionivibrio sp.]